MPEPTGDRSETEATTDLPYSRRRCLELTGMMLLGGVGVGTASARESTPADEAGGNVTGRSSTRTDASATGDDASGDGGSNGPVVGGGEGYEHTVAPEQADVTVGNRSELQTALSRATSGDVVYVAGDATIDMGGAEEWSIPSGVTLASNRGIDGASGGLLRTTELPWPLFVVGKDARVTGLRVSGQYDEYVDYTDGPVSIGLQAAESGVEIDNCEVSGFSHAAIRPYTDTHVHHNDIHHNSMDGLGYGVSVTRGEPLIEYNYFNYNRHSVAGAGGCGYTVRYNHFGPEAVDHVIDQHEPGGTTMEVHHNTVEAVSHVQNDGEPEAVAIRGTPDDVASIHHNWFYNPDEPKSSPDDWDGSAITQVNTGSWENVEFQSNHYGSDEPAGDIGCPRY